MFSKELDSALERTADRKKGFPIPRKQTTKRIFVPSSGHKLKKKESRIKKCQNNRGSGRKGFLFNPAQTKDKPH